MGRKGDRETTKGAVFCDGVVARLEPLRDVTSRKMFGGYGIFQAGKMFALITSRAELFMKTGPANEDRFKNVGAAQHGKMPYFRPPDDVLDDDAELLAWARTSVEAAHA